MSLPGLVSQRQCKVTARRTRASRCRHVCKELRQPLPMRFLVTAPFPCVLFYAIFQHISASSPYHAHRPCGNVPPLHLFFLCSASYPLHRRLWAYPMETTCGTTHCDCLPDSNNLKAWFYKHRRSLFIARIYLYQFLY